MGVSKHSATTKSDSSMHYPVKFGNKRRQNVLRDQEIERSKLTVMVEQEKKNHRDEQLRRCVPASQTARGPCATEDTASPFSAPGACCSLPGIKNCDYRFVQRSNDGGWVMESQAERRQECLASARLPSGTDLHKKRFIAGRNESKMNPLIDRDDVDEEFDPELVQAAERFVQRGGGLQTECDLAHGWHGAKKFIAHPPAAMTPESVSLKMMDQPAVGIKFPVLVPTAPHPLRQYANQSPGQTSTPRHLPRLHIGDRVPCIGR